MSEAKQYVLEPKRFSQVEIDAVDWVKNVSGAILSIPDLSEDGAEGKGLTLRPNETVQLNMLVSLRAKRRSKDLRRALEGYPGGDGFDRQLPKLMPLKSEEEGKLISTIPASAALQRIPHPQEVPASYYDYRLAEEGVKSLEDELASSQSPERKVILSAAIEIEKKKLETMKASIQVGSEAGVKFVVQEGATVKRSSLSDAAPKTGVLATLGLDQLRDSTGQAIGAGPGAPVNIGSQDGVGVQVL